MAVSTGSREVLKNVDKSLSVAKTAKKTKQKTIKHRHCKQSVTYVMDLV